MSEDYEEGRKGRIGDTVKCKYCGGEFKKSYANQKYCSKECSQEWWRNRHKVYLEPRKCKTCGKIFQPKNHYHNYCSPECVKNKVRASYTVPAEEAPNRHISRLTAYLIQKWHKEGESIKTIAGITKRSIENVEKALSMPLTLNEYKMMVKYFIPKKGTRK